MPEPIVVQSPTVSLDRLILLFHGVGGTPQDMLSLGRRLAAEFPQAAVINVPSPDPCDMGRGYQWFSVQGITEENRERRIAATMPRFVHAVRAMREAFGATVAQTVLIGFSQGAVMTLASTGAAEALAGRVVAIAGRFVHLPEHAPTSTTTVHFIHGASDQVVPCWHAVAAAERLSHLGANATIDVIPSLGHGINEEASDRLIERLKR